MTDLIQAAKEQAAQLTQAAYETAAREGLLPAGAELRGAVETPRDGRKGDFASSFAMAGAAALHLPPKRIAQIILDRLELGGSFFERAELAGPGYLNFFCAPRWYGAVLAAVEGLPPPPPPPAPLPAPPAPLAEVRRQAWGDALTSLLRRTGADAPPAQDMGPVLLLRDGRPFPGGSWAQAGQDALRYFLTSRPAGRTVGLDVDLAMRRDGGNPLYYVQYTHARICALIASMAGETCVPAAAVNPAALAAQEEWALAKALARYPGEIRLAAGRFDPSRVSRCLTALAGDTRRFYQACPIKSGGALQAARLKLADCARLALADGLGLLGVSAPRGA